VQLSALLVKTGVLQTITPQMKHGQQSHQSIIWPHPSGLRWGRRCMQVGQLRSVLWRLGSCAAASAPGLCVSSTVRG